MPIATRVLVRCSGEMFHFWNYQRGNLWSALHCHLQLCSRVLPQGWDAQVNPASPVTGAISRLHLSSPARFHNGLFISPYLAQYKVWVPVLH